MPGGGRLALRRYHAQATPQDLSYEHFVLRFLARAGWIVPAPAGERALTGESPRLGSWAHAAATQARDALGAIGARDLPVIVVHGDFHEPNVHYEHGHLAGVVDFALTHLDSRPYELAIARTYRAPEIADAYRAELARLGWPLSELEVAALGPVSRAFRVDMAAWQMDHGRRTGRYDLAMIERQLSKTGTAPP
jgi:aminoglycoside phosphotransferase (APT) family kinase protein